MRLPHSDTLTLASNPAPTLAPTILQTLPHVDPDLDVPLIPARVGYHPRVTRPDLPEDTLAVTNPWDRRQSPNNSVDQSWELSTGPSLPTNLGLARVAGSVPGTAVPQDPSNANHVIFQSYYHLQRPALLLAHGQVWCGFRVRVKVRVRVRVGKQRSSLRVATRVLTIDRGFSQQA